MVEKVKLTVLVEDSISKTKQGLIAKHGLSFFIEGETDGEKFSLLMDTGPSPDIVLPNADAMGIDLAKIDAIFLSHGHYDHTGGLIGILKSINKKIPVIAHPQVFDAKLKLKPAVKLIGAPFKPTDVEASGGVLLLARNSITIAKGIITTGEIERETPFEKAEEYWTINEERFVKDTMPDDQALIIEIDGKGLVIVSGCAHSGIINTTRQARKVTGVNKVYAVLGGFHLTKADSKTIQSTVEELIETDLEIVAPCHCTGPKVVHRLVRAFGDGCKPLRTGDMIIL